MGVGVGDSINAEVSLKCHIATSDFKAPKEHAKSVRGKIVRGGADAIFKNQFFTHDGLCEVVV